MMMTWNNLHTDLIKLPSLDKLKRMFDSANRYQLEFRRDVADPKKAGMSLTQQMQFIPQFMERPIQLERLAYKASEGSYKAPDMLQSLLRFAATAVLGGDPWTDMTSGDMEDRLRHIYKQWFHPPDDDPAPLDMAIKWAWPPLKGGWVIFESDELMLGVEALYLLIGTVAPDHIAARLAGAYQLNDSTDTEFFELGQTMWYLGAQHHDLVAASELDSAANNVHLIRGWKQEAHKSAETTEADSAEPSRPNRLRILMRGAVSGIASGIVGGGLFGVFVHIAEQFDGKYDDPTLLTIIAGIPIFSLIGAVVGLPFGLASGVLFGLIAPNHIAPQQAPRIGLIGGALFGAVIGLSLQGVALNGNLEQLFWELLLIAMAALCGAVGGRAGGGLFKRLSRRQDS